MFHALSDNPILLLLVAAIGLAVAILVYAYFRPDPNPKKYGSVYTAIAESSPKPDVAVNERTVVIRDKGRVVLTLDLGDTPVGEAIRRVSEERDRLANSEIDQLRSDSVILLDYLRRVLVSQTGKPWPEIVATMHPALREAVARVETIPTRKNT